MPHGQSSLSGKRRAFVFVLALAAVAGFAFGRLSGGSGEIPDETVKRDFPMLPAPPKETAKPAQAAEQNIVLEEPIAGAAVGSAFDVVGRARVFDNHIDILVRDGKGNAVVRASATADAEAGQFGRFRSVVSLPAGLQGSGTVEVFWTSREDGTVKDKVTREISFSSARDVPVRVYFLNSQLDPEMTCLKVFPLTRYVTSQAQVYRSALEELFKNLNEGELTAGYFSNIPAGVKVNSVVQDAGGTVFADFSAELEKGAGGSCRVAAIRAQIEATLKQFPEVRNVAISINGESEDILQP